MKQLSGISRGVGALVLLGALTTLSTTAMSAQDAALATRTAAVPDARWQPWLGCWNPVGAVSTAVSSTTLCVVPGPNAASISIVNFSGGTVTERALIAPGQPVTKKAGDCTGTEMATWSADGRRIMLRGTFKCANGVSRVETGVMSINVDGEWVQAQGINVGGNPSMYVAHFRDTGMDIEGIRGDTIFERPVLDGAGRRISPSRTACTGTESVTRGSDDRRLTVRSDYLCGGLHLVANAEFVRDSSNAWSRVNAGTAQFGLASMRAAAGAPVTTEDVLEVAKVVDPAVTEAWITDRNQSFELTGKQLVSLADRGMPARVIDMMVAISNPRTFSVRTTDMPGGLVGDLADDRRGNERTTSSGYGMTGVGWMYGANIYYGLNPYGYPNGYGYGNGYGYRNGYGYGNNWGSGYYGGGPPVVIVGPPPPAQPRGRAVYGQGYTRKDASSPGSASMARSARSVWASDAYGPTSSPSSRGLSSSSPRSAPSSAPSSSSSGSSTGSSSGEAGRTAKPRGGGN